VASSDGRDEVAARFGAAREAVGPAATLVGVIGSPIAHSLSPQLHAAAFAALGLTDLHSVAIEVPAGLAADAVRAVRAERFAGISVTMPHKADVAQAVDECTEQALRLGAVNCVVHRDGVLLGANTDGEGFVASLARGAGLDPAGRRCLVIGAGGAARAVILALAEAGASLVTVMNRTPARAAEAATLAGAVGAVADVDDHEAVAQAELVVNATSVGLLTDEGADRGVAAPFMVAPSLLHVGQLAVDLVYEPRPTPWLSTAAAAGASTLDGLGMLVHQAAAQIRLWTGEPAPLAAMWAAVST
jgi:shikimate dehydrogenase